MKKSIFNQYMCNKNVYKKTKCCICYLICKKIFYCILLLDMIIEYKQT